MARKAKVRTRKSRSTRIMTVACIILFFALAATIFFGEKLLRDRQDRIINGVSCSSKGIKI